MTNTLFSDIQKLFERTYASVGINLEDCLIDQMRCGQLSRLAGASARELSELARTFLRRVNGNLHIGIPIRFRHEPGRIDPRLPKLGEHTEALLTRRKSVG